MSASAPLSPTVTLFLASATEAIRPLAASRPSIDGPVRVLEVGCGRGALSGALAGELGSVVTVTGIDPFPGAVAAAKEAHAAVPNLTFQESDLLSFSAPDASFEVILCQRSLHHIFPLDKAVSKLHSLLAPNGILLADEFDRSLVTLPGAQFLCDRLDLFRALGVLGDNGPFGHGHGHDHGGHGGHGGHDHAHDGGSGHDHGVGQREGHGDHAHGHGGHGDHSHAHTPPAEDRPHSGYSGHGGQSHDHGDAHDSDHSHSPPPTAPTAPTGPVPAPALAPSPDANLTYVHGHSHVGRTPPDGLPRDGDSSMSPLARWARMTVHNPPLPGGAAMLSALHGVFGESNVSTKGGYPSLYLMATHKVVGSEEVKREVQRVVKEQEEREIGERRFVGIGVVYTCVKKG